MLCADEVLVRDGSNGLEQLSIEEGNVFSGIGFYGRHDTRFMNKKVD